VEVACNCLSAWRRRLSESCSPAAPASRWPSVAGGGVPQRMPATVMERKSENVSLWHEMVGKRNRLRIGVILKGNEQARGFWTRPLLNSKRWQTLLDKEQGF
jgi:hypothetical protein